MRFHTTLDLWTLTLDQKKRHYAECVRFCSHVLQMGGDPNDSILNDIGWEIEDCFWGIVREGTRFFDDNSPEEEYLYDLLCRMRDRYYKQHPEWHSINWLESLYGVSEI